MIFEQLQNSDALKSVAKDVETMLNDKFVEQWDEDYKAIICSYGSVENFIEAHYKDYNIYRSNVLVFISQVKELSAGVKRATKHLTDTLSNRTQLNSFDKSFIATNINCFEIALIEAIDRVAEEATVFVEGEEEAHHDNKEVRDILDKLSKEIKEVNFYEQKEDKSINSRKNKS